MIWVGGRVVPDDALKISVLDRTFEHGLGLFETLRTWDGRAPLLGRHLERLTRSARELGLPLDPAMLPDDAAVSALLDAEEAGGDRVLRITLTGGLSGSVGSTLWMRSAPLPPPLRRDGAVVELNETWPPPTDPLARHKSLNYWARRRAFESAQRLGFDEALGATGFPPLPGIRPPPCLIWEGSRSNVFAVRGSDLITPPTDAPIVPGVMRGLVLERARELALKVAEDVLRRDELAGAGEVFLTNSVRGIIPVARMMTSGADRLQHNWPAPGPWTRRLSILVNDWLRGGGTPA